MRIFVSLFIVLSSITTLVQAQHEQGYFELDDMKKFFTGVIPDSDSLTSHTIIVNANTGVVKTDAKSGTFKAESTKEMEWSFSFDDNQQTKLEKLAKEFEKEGLKIVEIRKIVGEHEVIYLLTCYEVKIYTPELLLKRINKLISIAKKYHLHNNVPGYNIPGIGYGINQYN